MRCQSSEGRGTKKVLIIIEHLEPVLGRWIWLEYAHVSKMVGPKNLLFTHVGRRSEANQLRKIGNVSGKSIVNLLRSRNATTIILDPRSSNLLSPSDFSERTSLVVGGILGDYPPRGRTKMAITDKIPYLPSRNLGSRQFSVDGAVHIALEVCSGKPVSDIPTKTGIEITFNKHYSTFLPFAYPLVGGKPLLAPGLKEYLRKGVLKDEEILLRTGKAPSVA
jgi:ribosome biogenesis SPOUT family RNA methylase Rps3